MPKMIDLTGKVFGELVVLKRVENDRYGKPRWLVRCSCGNEVIKPGNHLKDSRFCRRGGHSRIGNGVGAFNSLYRQIKQGAVRRGYDWNLSETQVRKLSQMNCFYCNTPPCQTIDAKSHRVIGDFVYNGIDRLDNSIGYIPENCVPCCGKCNTMKMDMSITEFRDKIIKIFNHWIPKSLIG